MMVRLTTTAVVAAAVFLASLPATTGQENRRPDKIQVTSTDEDWDVRDNRLYRRPPTYLIIASKIVRPSTIYQVGGT